MAPSDKELWRILMNAPSRVTVDGLRAVFEAGVVAERERIAPYRQKWEEVIAAEGFEAAVEVYARQYHDSACIYQKQIAEVVAAERERAARIAESKRPWNYDDPDDWTDKARLAAELADETAAAIRGDREPEPATEEGGNRG